MVLNLIHFLIKVAHGVLLQGDLAPGLFDLILQAFNHHGLSLTSIDLSFVTLHLLFLTFAIF